MSSSAEEQQQAQYRDGWRYGEDALSQRVLMDFELKLERQNVRRADDLLGIKT